MEFNRTIVMLNSGHAASGVARIFVLGVFMCTASVSNAGENTLSLLPAPLNPPSAGTTFIWKNVANGETRENVAVGTDGLRIVNTWKGRERKSYFLCQHCSDRDMDIDEQSYATLWPLEVGKSITVKRSNGEKSWTNNITVVGTEKLELEFGTVETYHVVDKSTKHACCWDGVRDYWFAPKFGWVMKIKNDDTDKGQWHWEVIAVKTP